MIKDYKPGFTEERTDYYLLFYVDRSGGLAFPCDENGNLLQKNNYNPDGSLIRVIKPSDE